MSRPSGGHLDDSLINLDPDNIDNDIVDVSDRNQLVLNASPMDDEENGGAVGGAGGSGGSGAIRRTNPFGGGEHSASSVVGNVISGGPYDNSRHCHPQVSPPRDSSAQRQLMAVTVVCFVFMTGELVGGLLAHSIAILTDAAHMLSDFASFLISILAIWVAKRNATKQMSFGFYRAEVLGAVVSILMIWILTGVLVYLAVERIVHPVHEIDADIMIITAACGILFNIVMGVMLHRGGHGHSHGLGGHSHSHGGHGHGHSHNSNNHGHSHGRNNNNCSHQPPPSPPSNGFSNNDTSVPIRFSVSAYPIEELHHVNKHKNINVRAALIHVLGDLVQSIGVFIAALVIKFKPEWKIADPICTFIFSVLVLVTTCTVLRDAVHVLMEGTPRDVDYDKVRADLQSIDGVRAVHSLHMWSLTMDKAALAVHLAIEASCDALKIMHEASKMMRFKYNLTFTTIQVEPFDPDIMLKCSQCLGPRR